MYIIALFAFLGYFCVFCTGATDWNRIAKDTLTNALRQNVNTNLAKNIIIFIGDGMGMSTITASRIYKGQKYLNTTGEETVLKFEEFPHVALSKTYIVDRQVADSASTATAILTGIKTNIGILGLNESFKFGDCDSEAEARDNKVLQYSILHHSKTKGKSTGIITTARVTHATPAASYAHSVNRLMENDGDVELFGGTGKCKDIAYQLVYDNHDIEVVMGGGRRNFLPNTETDPENNENGRRQDGRNLISGVVLIMPITTQKSETIALEEAVIKAVEMTNQDDTLIIVTADHSHVFTIGGYPLRGNDITGIAEPFDAEPPLDGMPYTTLAYGNGPGVNFTAGRQNLTDVDTGDPNYIYQSAVPTTRETHGGEDVPIFAIGPMSHLFHGVHEQNYIAHVMQYAACVGDYSDDCDRPVKQTIAPSTCPTSHAPISHQICLVYIALNVFIAMFVNTFCL